MQTVVITRITRDYGIIARVVRVLGRNGKIINKTMYTIAHSTRDYIIELPESYSARAVAIKAIQSLITRDARELFCQDGMYHCPTCKDNPFWVSASDLELAGGWIECEYCAGQCERVG